jgi:hypothetical protein
MQQLPAFLVLPEEQDQVGRLSAAKSRCFSSGIRILPGVPANKKTGSNSKMLLPVFIRDF